MTSSSILLSALRPLSRPPAPAQWVLHLTLGEPGHELVKLPAVEDVLRLQPGALGYVDAELHLVELTWPVPVRVDRYLQSEVLGAAREDVIQVQSCRAGIDLYRRMPHLARPEDLLQVDVVRRTRLDLAPGGVPEDVDVGRADGPHDPRGHLGARLPELRVHRGDHDVQLGQDLVGHGEASVGEGVDLHAAERPEALV